MIDAPANVAVVGAGRMGHGIALEFARGGHHVRLFDTAPGRAAAAIEEARRDASDLVSAGLIAPDEVDDVVARLEASDHLVDAVGAAELVTEAIIEEIGAKQALFAELDRLCAPSAILASNTSGISITAIGAVCQRPERVVLTHWLLPPHLIPVIEIASPDGVDQSALERTRRVLEALGKWPVHVRRDVPGYLMNRIQFALAREAMHLVAEGIATPEELDRLVRGALARRMPTVGVFGQADMAGLDVYYLIYSYLSAELDASAEPPVALAEKIAAGHTGAAAGRGFYEWPPGELDRMVAARNAELIRLLRQDREGASGEDSRDA